MEIIPALPQWGQDKGKDAEAVVQIAAELTSGDAVLQITIGGSNDAYVGLNGLVTPHTFKLLCLQYPQDLRLGERRHIADLIEKERTARTLLKLADAFALCTRKRSSLMAKQLAFQQRFGDSGTVDGQERGSGPLAVMVNRPRHQLFARASLAAYEHSDVLWRHPANGLVHILHGRTSTYQHIRRLADWFVISHRRHSHEAADRTGPRHEFPQVSQFQWFEEVVKGPELHRFNGCVGRPVA